MLVKANFPALSVVVERSRPLTGLRISTVALGTTAPVGSTTLPLIEPEFPDWAPAVVIRIVTAKIAINRRLYEVVMSPPGRSQEIGIRRRARRSFSGESLDGRRTTNGQVKNAEPGLRDNFFFLHQ